jgi:IS5 family transposase
MDWSKYNAALVRRGELLLDLDVMENWEEELEGANSGKVGNPYEYPESLIRLLGFVHVLFHLPYRQTEGFTRALARYVKGLKTPDYSTIDRRVNRLKLQLEGLEDIQPDEPLTLALDASGVKVHNGGDWIRRVWKVRKGYLKIHLAVDVKSRRILAVDVTGEKTHDAKRLKSLVEKASKGHVVGRVLADGAYDSRENFRFLADQGIEPVIKVRRSSTGGAKGCYARKVAVVEQLGDRVAWAVRHGYGFRWSVEGAFSCLKRTFGEYVSARKFANMTQEMLLKANLYNLLIGLTQHP